VGGGGDWGVRLLVTKRVSVCFCLSLLRGPASGFFCQSNSFILRMSCCCPTSFGDHARLQRKLPKECNAAAVCSSSALGQQPGSWRKTTQSLIASQALTALLVKNATDAELQMQKRMTVDSKQAAGDAVRYRDPMGRNECGVVVNRLLALLISGNETSDAGSGSDVFLGDGRSGSAGTLERGRRSRKRFPRSQLAQGTQGTQGGHALLVCTQ
jgi:hypothetical protein